MNVKSAWRPQYKQGDHTESRSRFPDKERQTLYTKDARGIEGHLRWGMWAVAHMKGYSQVSMGMRD